MKELKSFSLLLARVSVFSLGLSALGGCVTTQGIQSGQDSQEPLTDSVTIKVEKEPVRSFEPETVYDLLVAELGGQRKRYDLALGNYLKQAHKTRDVGVAERAYQISMFIGARQASLDAALLWAELAPDDAHALQASAIELVRDGQLDRAVDQMRKILDLHGEANFDFLASSAAELSDEDRDSLLKTFDTILKEYPYHRSLMLGKAILLQQAGRNDEAMLLCDQLLKRDPEYVKALILKGRILNQLGRGEEAEQMLADAVELHPDRPRLRLLYARVLVHLNKLDQARIQFEELLKQSPHDVEILISLALIALENDMPDRAETYFKRLLKLGQRKGTAYYYLGRISEKKGNLKEAETYFLNVPPGKEFMRAQVSLVQLMLSQGRLKDARKYLGEARNRYPIHAVQLYMLETEILTGAGEYNEALGLFDAAVLRHPENVNLLYARAMLQERLGKLEGLEKDLRTIIKLQPDNAAALNALGYTLADRTDRYEEARALIEKAYSIDSDDPAIMDSMGWVNYRLGNLEAALKYLKQAYEKFPDHEVAAHLGEVLWMMGRRDEAIALWKEALEKKPESEILRSTRERLEKQAEPKGNSKAASAPVASRP
ncbi:tetratricopeptide repeat protein [Endozoicomonas gorgoniicola]|uniref:Tetratricopeptide repeat protein n=1 Tax=Endozoicomonas gorgoniicola TaxID=1234144 RepID=A0ABT3N480_9GAMM|nr:tetratricopeptide repeat protein [Endozoicomonas gorgoniicola]MCW7556437.1 tetratricopeptide repeat protein [Endozoicomonas gorgoniicola]